MNSPYHHPRTVRDGQRFRFNLGKANAQCVDGNDQLYEYGQFNDVDDFTECANVCVNDAVIGLAGRTKRVVVVEDAIKELPGIPLPFENWKKLGVEMMQLEELEGLILQ